MNEVWAQYGVLGAIIVALASWILKIENQRVKKEEEWRDLIKALAEKSKADLDAITHKHEQIVGKISEKHEDSINRITDVIDKRQAETNNVIRDHTNMLASIKSLIESTRRRT